jgi:hypothetical protein
LNLGVLAGEVAPQSCDLFADFGIIALHLVDLVARLAEQKLKRFHLACHLAQALIQIANLYAQLSILLARLLHLAGQIRAGRPF